MVKLCFVSKVHVSHGHVARISISRYVPSKIVVWLNCLMDFWWVFWQIVDLNGTEIGQISKKWSGLAREWFTDADFFGINFPMDLDVKLKATLVGACMLIVSGLLIPTNFPAANYIFNRYFTILLLYFRIWCTLKTIKAIIKSIYIYSEQSILAWNWENFQARMSRKNVFKWNIQQ